MLIFRPVASLEMPTAISAALTWQQLAFAGQEQEAVGNSRTIRGSVVLGTVLSEMWPPSVMGIIKWGLGKTRNCENAKTVMGKMRKYVGKNGVRKFG